MTQERFSTLALLSIKQIIVKLLTITILSDFAETWARKIHLWKNITEHVFYSCKHHWPINRISSTCNYNYFHPSLTVRLAEIKTIALNIFRLCPNEGVSV